MPVKFRDTININDSYTFPSADGTANQAIVTDGAGNLSFSTVTDGETVKIAVKNTSGSTITKGTPVYITGTVGASFTAEVAPADASNAAKMPSTGLLETDLANNAIGYAVTAGLLKNIVTDPIDTVTPSTNQTIYVKAGGGLTTAKPTGTNLIQNVGKVGRVSTTSDGSIIVASILRTNDIPNIPQNNIWLGNASSVPTPTSHTVGNISDVTLSTLSDGQVLTWDSTNSYWKNAAAAGGASQLSVEKNILTGDGSTVTFSVSSSIASENNTQVYIDGVYQSKDNYSTSGSNITFSTAPPNAAEIEVIHFVSVQGIIRTDTFTGDNSTVAFTVGTSIIDENNTQIYIDGVYQSKDNYTVSGSTITFSTAPSTSTAIEVVHIKTTGISTINDNQFTGDGSTVDFTLSNSVADENNTFVFINGVYQDKSTYSIAGATLTFSTAPQNGYTIEVMQFGEVAIADLNTDYNVSVISSNTTAVKKTLYVFTASLALTLPAGVVGNSIKISNRSGTTTCTLVPNGTDKIMGSNATLTLDNANASFEIIFSGTAQGWVIIGQ